MKDHPPSASNSPLAGPVEIKTYLRRRRLGSLAFFVLIAVTALVFAAVVAKGDLMAFLAAGLGVAMMAVLTSLFGRKLAQSWKGEVIRTEVRLPDRRDDATGSSAQPLHILHVQTDRGHRLELNVGPEALDRYYEPGQRLVKIGGLPIPLKVANGHPGRCPGCGHFLNVEIRQCPTCQCPVPETSRF